MNVSNLLSNDAPRSYRSQQTSDTASQEPHYVHQYPTRHSVIANSHPAVDHDVVQDHKEGVPAQSPGQEASPANPIPKTVTFELLFDGAANYRARLPLKVQIYPHDTTDSIVTTVKNFYGLYDGASGSFSFEDASGNILIARYENFANNMSVYVRAAPDYGQPFYPRGQTPYHPGSPQSAYRHTQHDEVLQMPPPQQALTYGQPCSRPNSRVARKRSTSPRNGRGGRSASIQKGRSRSGIKSRDTSVLGSFDEASNDAANGYSSSDGGAGSVTGSRKARSEQFASAEISLENVVEGGRRKRAKFDSSELPLFVPPQVPAANSISSISPQRRSNGQDNPSPFARPPQRTPSYNYALQSPQSYGFGEHLQRTTPTNASPYSMPAPNQHNLRQRDETTLPQAPTGPVGPFQRKQGPGILPTPDPTIASCISDEDVALQLMRLGDASNISYGRTSASTLDDTLSGRADIASSMGSHSRDESEETENPSVSLPQSQPGLKHGLKSTHGPNKKPCKQLNDGLASADSTEPSGDEVDGDYFYDDKRDGVLKADPDDLVNEHREAGMARLSGTRNPSSVTNKVRGGNPTKKGAKIAKRSGVPKKSRPSASSNAPKAPVSPASINPQSRKTSSASTLNFQHHLGMDEEDLSSKPRCQRCRKSKKGCDRQRPCQRCKDAGIGIEGCISEDEGNGRKGRFGRHMGVSVKKDVSELTQADDSQVAGAILTGMASNAEKSKKRKR